MFDYTVKPDQLTPKGMLIDTSGQDINLRLVDAIVGEGVRCLEDGFPGGSLPEQVQRDAYCAEDTINLLFDRASLILKTPNAYRFSRIDGQQLLMEEAPDQGCTDKGICEVGEDCDCYWRCGIQDACVIVSTPSLYMLKDPLIKIVSRCAYIYGDADLAACASPKIPKWGVSSDEVEDYIELLDSM